MRFDFLRLGRKLRCRSFVSRLDAFRIDVVNGHVRVGDGGLFEIFVDAAAATHVATLQFNGHARAAVQLRHPFDAVIRDVSVAFLSGWDVLAFTFAVDNFRLIMFGIDLNLEIMRGFFWRGLRDDLNGLARSEHPIHAGRADADTLLAAAHSQTVEFRSVEKLSEN
jgi:hypothetical protein